MDEISGDTDEFKNVIESLNKELNAKYQAVERCISIRNKSNVDIVRELACTADDLCRQLIDTHKSCKFVNNHAINSIWTNKLEFDALLKEWLASVAKAPESVVNTSIPVLSASNTAIAVPNFELGRADSAPASARPETTTFSAPDVTSNLPESVSRSVPTVLNALEPSYGASKIEFSRSN